MAVVAEHFGCAVHDWAWGRRSDDLGRAVAAYLARRRYGYPAAATAAVQGYRGHRGVGTAVARVEAAGERIARTLAALEKDLANA